MLNSVYKAYKQNLYDETNQLPFDIIEIETYIQILLPLYAFSNDLQNDMAHIGLVIPAVLSLIYENLDRMVLNDENQNKFRNDLIKYLKIKFEFELPSKEYLVASVLNVGYLDSWSKRSFASKYFQAGLDSIYEILAKNNLKDEENESDKDENNNKKDKLEKKLSQTGLKQTESLLSLRNITRGRILSDTDDLSKQNHGKVLKDEVKVFINIITETTFESTKKFWLK